MCIAVPARVIEIEEQSALVDVMGSRMHIGIFFVPEVNVYDYVLLHAGQAMTIVDENFAKESIEEWRNIIDAENGTIY